MNAVTAEARTACHRCQKRKKKCDRSLPQCHDCVAAQVACSFLDDTNQTGTYPIAFVQGLESKIKKLEQEVALATEFRHDQISQLSGPDSASYPAVGRDSLARRDCASDSSVIPPMVTSPALTAPGPTPPQTANTPSLSLVQELKTLASEAAAERHLGSSSGLSFARLTQTILRRLTPDRTDLVFESFQSAAGVQQSQLQAEWSSLTNLSNSLDFQLLQDFNWDANLFGDPSLSLADTIDPPGSLASLGLPPKSLADELVSFYFAHSHTLYPIISQRPFLEAMERVYDHPHDLLAEDPLCLFRIWMVLAIGSSSRCSISAAEESEPILYYNKALEYLEPCIECGDMAALEAIMLQVSFSFFNQLGPNCWFLVGIAARMAVGLGLHISTAYEDLPFDVADTRKRIFFSIYMMDRVVSIALGRPFALQDDDIEVEPFVEADDENIDAKGAHASDTFETPLIAVPLHILRLRFIASRIRTEVYGNKKTIKANMPRRHEIVQALHKELIDWRRSMPFPLPDVNPRVPHLSSTWYDFNYYTHLATLYRPSPLFPTLDQAQVRKLADAASMAIRQAHNMHRQKRFAYNWLNLLAVFTSTLSLIYATTVQPQELTSVLKENKVVDDLELTLQLLDKLGTKFPSANNIRSIVSVILGRYRDISGSLAGV